LADRADAVPKRLLREVGELDDEDEDVIDVESK
jgi:hypothetical protein